MSAQTRGWDLFEAHHSDCVRWEIERDDDAAIFSSDDEALAAAITAAANGDAYARKCLASVLSQLPPEHEGIAALVAAWGGIGETPAVTDCERSIAVEALTLRAEMYEEYGDPDNIRAGADCRALAAKFEVTK